MKELTAALVAAQKEFAPIAKSATNPHFRNKFVPLSELIQTVLPTLNKHGLALSQHPVTGEDGSTGLCTFLLHVSGEEMHTTMPLLLPKNDPQGQGSAITYARRYALMAILGVVGDEDDDAEKASSSRVSSTRMDNNINVNATSPLEAAKATLRRAIKSSGVPAKDYAWVKDATVADIDNILGLAKALESGKALDA